MKVTDAASAVDSVERKDTNPRVTILQLIRVPSVCVLLIASLFAAGSLTFLDPLLGEFAWFLLSKPNGSPLL